MVIYMARIRKEPHRMDPSRWKTPDSVKRRLRCGAGNPTLLRNEDIVVRVASFVFRFNSIEQLREYLAYFRKKTHPSSRISAKAIAAEFGEDWRKLRSWEIERWFERLPMYLFEGPKREKVIRALEKALKLAESGKLRPE